MTSSNFDAFGSEFLPGRDKEDEDGASRAMGRRFGGQVAKPFNSAESAWRKAFSDRSTKHRKS